jgi:hypothetical protein
MEILQMLIYLVLAIQVVLVIVTVYFYMRNKLRLFIFLSLGFLALLVATVLSIAMGYRLPIRQYAEAAATVPAGVPSTI